MSRVAATVGLLRRLPTVLRTLRPLRLEQARAQVAHALHGVPKPVRLGGPPPVIAVATLATDPLGPPAHVRSSGDGRIELLATPFDLGEETDWTDASHGPLFAYHLHQHEYLRLPAFEPRERARRMLDWIEHHRAGVGWDPHPISLRLLCWGKLLTTPGALELAEVDRARILGSMADQVETLARGIEIRLQANHLLSNLIALVWTGILLEGTRSAVWRAHAGRLVAEIEAQIHPDGGHEERSPMYHSLLLENLLDLLSLCRAAPQRLPEGLVEVLQTSTARMLSALEVWTHPDGRIALFADSGFDIAAEPARLVEYAGRLGVRADPTGDDRAESRLLSQTGYARLGREGVDLIASIAGPAPAHQPGHAHCDALSFELSLRDTRVVTDTGLYEYVPGARRDRARSTAAHATVQIDGEEQAEIWSAHRVGGRPVVECIAWNGEDHLEATCRGWSRPETLHRRSYRLEPDSVTIVDRLEGPVREARVSFPFDPVWQLELEPERRAARATRASGAGGPAGGCVEIELDASLAWHLDRAPYYPTFGRELERVVLVGEGSSSSVFETRIRWVD